MGSSISDLIPELQPAAHALVDAAGAAGLLPRITSTVRTRTEQARLYADFVAGRRAYPVAPPGTSAHEYGWAFDMVVSPMSALADVGYTWQQWGGVWHPSDEVHFEYPGFKEALAASGGAGGSYDDTSRTDASAEAIADLLLGFIPGLGAVMTGATLASFFTKNELIDMLASPAKAVDQLAYKLGFPRGGLLP